MTPLADIADLQYLPHSRNCTVIAQDLQGYLDVAILLSLRTFR